MKLLSWRELFGLKPRLQDLARFLLDTARARGDAGWSYDARAGALRQEQGNGVLHLQNIFLEYLNSSRGGRAALLDKYASMMHDIAHEIPAMWTLAAKAIYPVVRSTYDAAFLEIHSRMQGGAPLRPAVCWPLASDLNLRLVYDHGASLAHVNQDQLQTWGQSQDAVRQKAFDNLRALERPTWQEISPGVHQIVSTVSFEETLFLVDAVMERLPFAATAAVMPANRGVLLAADGTSDQAMLALLDHASSTLRENPWPMSATLLQRQGSEWVEFIPQGLVLQRLRSLQQINLHGVYRDQAELLQKELGEDVFVATFALIQRGEGLENVRSWCTWSEGVPTLMPMTDLVVIAKQRADGEFGPGLMLEWAHLWNVCGHRMQASVDSPSRFMVKSFPDATEWQQLEPLGERIGA
jgi:hypothetical protein